MSGVGFGIDIGGTKVAGVAVDASGEVVASVRRPTRAGADGVVASALEVIRELDRRAERDTGRPIGVGVPGRVDAAGRVLHPVNLGLTEPELPLAAILGGRLGQPVVVENDVNVAALGARAWLGQQPSIAVDVDNVAYLSLGTGVAAGLIVDGALRRGATGSCGEVGHVPIADGPACGCGQSGCVELFASGRGLARLWRTPRGYALPALMKSVGEGDGRALAVWHQFTDAVAGALRILALSVDPACFILGGGLTNVGDGLLVGVQEALGRQAAGSPFLASLRIAERVFSIPPGLPVGALGAAVMTRDAARPAPLVGSR